MTRRIFVRAGEFDESVLMGRLHVPQRFVAKGVGPSDTTVHQWDLPDWVMTLPGVSRIVDRIGICEFRRRLFHMSPALAPIGLPFISHSHVWGIELMSLLVIVTIVGLYAAWHFGSWMIRDSHEIWMVAVLGYSLPILAPLYLLRGHAEFGLMTLQIVALGDGSATLGGLMMGGWRLPWNRTKTVSGLLCFVIVGGLAATYSYWGEAQPDVSVGTAFIICLVSAAGAAVVESLPIRSNDNLRVGLSALFLGLIMSSLLTR